jgi:voltage-gated potassium channel
MPRRIWRRDGDLRRRLYEILEHGAIGNRTGLIVGRLIVVLIVTNLVTMTLDSVPALQAQYGPLFIAIELLSLVVFTIEYGLRVWVAAEHAPHRHASERKARWEFVSSPLGVIDLLAVLPFWFAFVLPVDLRVLLVFRMVRFLKLARYSPAMRSLLPNVRQRRQIHIHGQRTDRRQQRKHRRKRESIRTQHDAPRTIDDMGQPTL